MSGHWSPSLSACHINILELMAILLTLRSLNPPKGSHIRLFMDNLVAVHCLKRGGSRAPALNHVVLAIIKLLSSRNWFLPPFHLAEARNVLADSLSRLTPQDSDL